MFARVTTFFAINIIFFSSYLKIIVIIVLAIVSIVALFVLISIVLLAKSTIYSSFWDF